MADQLDDEAGQVSRRRSKPAACATRWRRSGRRWSDRRFASGCCGRRSASWPSSSRRRSARSCSTAGTSPSTTRCARRDMAAFLHQLLVFAMIAGGLLVLNIGQTWLNQMIRLKLREALTLDLIDQWMRPARAFRLANAGAIGVNPDQRMQQDAAHLSDLSHRPRRRSAAVAASCSCPSSACLWEAVVGLRLPCRRQVAGHTRLHGLGGVPLCRHRPRG